MKIGEKMKCENCRKEIVRTSSSKKYCADCKKLKDREKVYNFTKRNPKKIREWHNKVSRKERQKHKDRTNARTYANRINIKGEHCQICGSKENLERHHQDYSKPYDILIVYKPCHNKIHWGIKNGI